MIERKIIIGLITSTDYIKQIQNIWDTQLLESQMAKRLATWCLEYFDKYNRAPGKDIEGIYFRKLKSGLPKDIAEEIEEDILPALSDEYEHEKFNLDYLLDQTHTHLSEKHLEQHSQEIQALVEEGNLTEAEKLANNYAPLAKESGTDLDLSSETVLLRIEKAFDHTSQPVMTYPGQLGIFINDELVRGGFVSFMAKEKLGKTFLLLDMALRGARQKANVAFFQAGDMTEGQWLKRVCVYLTKKSDKKKHCGKMFQPVRDCARNQLDLCDKEERECDFGIFEGRTEAELRKGITLKELKEQYENNPDYEPCRNCEEWVLKHLGTVWIEEVEVKEPLTVKEAKKAADEFFIKAGRCFKLSSHANDTLTIREIKATLDVWEKQDSFVPDIIIIDYADLLVPDDSSIEFRHQQNKIWKGLRSLSQTRHCLVVTATQTDADSYDRNRLTMKNFSEDKRKYAHVTAMYGLNQDTHDREKRLKIMRINKIVVREDEFTSTDEVVILQNLKRGRPYLGSFL